MFCAFSFYATCLCSLPPLSAALSGRKLVNPASLNGAEQGRTWRERENEERENMKKERESERKEDRQKQEDKDSFTATTRHDQTTASFADRHR